MMALEVWCHFLITFCCSTYKPRREKTGLQVCLYSHRKRPGALNFGFKKRNCTLHVAKAKVLISCAVTAHSADLHFCFHAGKIWFSHDKAHVFFYFILSSEINVYQN